MTYRVIIQPRAEQDILDSARYILDQSKSSEATLRWVRGIRAKIDTLKYHPLRCPIDSDTYGGEVRTLLFGKKRGQYRVLFTIHDDDVRVLTVRPSARRGIGDGPDEGDAGPVH